MQLQLVQLFESMSMTLDGRVYLDPTYWTLVKLSHSVKSVNMMFLHRMNKHEWGIGGDFGLTSRQGFLLLCLNCDLGI